MTTPLVSSADYSFVLENSTLDEGPALDNSALPDNSAPTPDNDATFSFTLIPPQENSPPENFDNFIPVNPVPRENSPDSPLDLVENGLVGYWSFNEGEGDIAHDGSGLGNHGTIHGAQWVDGILGKALDFDGVDDYVVAPPISFGDELSLEVWFRPENVFPLPTEAFGLVCSRQLGIYKGLINFVLWIGPEGVVGFSVASDGADSSASWRGLEENLWYHIVGTWINHGETKLYVNGRLENSEPSGDEPRRLMENVVIATNGCLVENRMFDGVIDEVRIYNRALSAEEIYTHYLRGVAVDNTPPSSIIDSIEPEWKIKEFEVPFTITATANDNISGVSKVELWYRYSWDNQNWGAWEIYGVDYKGLDNWSWDFTAPDGYGYYEFLSIATDRAGNRENKGNALMENLAEARCVVAIYIETAFGTPPNVELTAGGVNTSIGNFVYQVRDISVPGEVPINFVRTYNSRDDYIGPFGRGWTHSYNLRLSFEELGELYYRVILVNEDGKRDIYFWQNGEITPLLDTYADLASNPSGDSNERLILTRPGGMKFYFNVEGRLTKIVDRDGKSIYMGYEGELLKMIKDSAGNPLLEFLYDRGRITRVDDKIGDRHVYFIYVDYDNRWLREYRDLRGDRYLYNYAIYDGIYDHTLYGIERLNSITQPKENLIFKNLYNAKGRVVEQKDGAGYRTTFSYSAGWTAVIDNAGNTTNYNFNPYYQTAIENDPLGYSNKYSFDREGHLTKIVDKRGNQTVLNYDGAGNLTNVTEKDGGSFTLTYDQNGNLENVTDPLLSTTNLGYDRGRLASLTNPMGKTYRLEYYDDGRLKKITDANGNATTITYVERVTNVTDAEGNRSQYKYDELGRLAFYTDPRNNTTSFTYYADGSIKTITNPSDGIITFGADGGTGTTADAGGGTTEYRYDGNGNLTWVKDPNGNETSYGYDGMNRLNQVEVGDSTTRYDFNYLGLLETVTDARGHKIRYGYNARGDLISVTDNLGRVTSFDYDANGNASSQTDAMGRSTSYSYDAADRMTKATYPDGSVASFTYNQLGKLASASRGGQTATLGYDRLGRIENYEFNGNLVCYNYDNVGMLENVEYPGSQMEFEYYRNYNLKSARGDYGWAEYSYDPAGNLDDIILSNGLVVDYEWDACNRLKEVTTVRVAPFWQPILASFSYEYDANGNRTQEIRRVAGGEWEYITYGYDSLNQLENVRVENSQGVKWTRTYTYDALGNRTRMVENRLIEGNIVTTVFDYTYDNANQLLRIDGSDGSFTEFTYDANGNMTGELRWKAPKGKKGPSLDENRSYFYDFDDRLLRVEISRGKSEARTVVEYEYDALGNRVARKEYSLSPTGGKSGEKAQYYVNDVSGPLTQVLQTRGAHGKPQDFLYGVNRVAAFGEQIYFYIYDGLGSVVALADENGDLMLDEYGNVVRYSYDEWGVPTDWPRGIPNTFGFAGEDYDPVTGLVFLRARYYKPDIGRFLTRDEVTGPLMDPLAWNPYIYARNNPTTLTDPSGKLWWLIFAIFLVGFTGGTVYYAATTPREQWSVGGWLGFATLTGFLALAAAAAPALAAKGIVWLGTHLGFNVTATSLKVVVASGIIAGGTMGFASRVVFNVLAGRDWKEGWLESVLIGMALGGLVGATGHYAGLAVASVGGSATYVYVGQKIITSVLRETVRYESKYIEWIYVQKFR